MLLSFPYRMKLSGRYGIHESARIRNYVPVVLRSEPRGNPWILARRGSLEAARFVDEFKSPAGGLAFRRGQHHSGRLVRAMGPFLSQRILKLHIEEFRRKKADQLGKVLLSHWGKAEQHECRAPSLEQAGQMGILISAQVTSEIKPFRHKPFLPARSPARTG